MAKNVYKVFVYGTLKSGEPNYHVFKNASDGYFNFICNAETTEKFPLIIGTQYNVPFLLYKPGFGNLVKGEIFEVDDKVLKDLDALEDHPNFYIREEHIFKNLDSNEPESIKSWIYFIKKFKQSLLNEPTYSFYSSKGDHGREYIASEETMIDDLNGIIDETS